jgi:hypothetical protein
MKRFLCVCMCIFILTISVLTYFPTCVYAADDFTLSTAEGGNISSDEANRAVNNKGDIYNANHEILFRYTPTSDYNWTYVNWDVHCSDVQVVACLRSNNKFEAFGALLKAGVSHNAFSRVMLSQLGFLVSENSELGTDFLDRITGNYNYLNAIEYDPNTGDLTLLADQVTALRNELKERYYDSIGLKIIQASGTVKSYLSSDEFRNMFNDINDYSDSLSRMQDLKFILVYGNYSMSVRTLGFNNYLCNDFLFADTGVDIYYRWDNGGHILHPICFNDGGSVSKLVFSSDCYDIVNDRFSSEMTSISVSDIELLSYLNYGYMSLYSLFFSDNDTWLRFGLRFYSDKDLYCFESYQSYYNYLHGSQNAFLSSKVEQAGEDIKLSINNLNDNIGSKMDELIDSINNKKDGMTPDELQKAIDNALNSISGKIDDIGNNTQETNNKLDALLESISGTNELLMQILGVTTDIRDIVKTQNEEGNDYTMNDVQNCFNTMFNNLKYSILYGKNVTNKPDAANVSTAAYVSYSDVSTSADTSAETLDYKDGLLGKFPFSVPYQMYEWLQVLQVDEKVPQFTYNYGFLIGQKGKQEYDLTFDLTQYQPWADVLKSFLRLSFTLIMSVFIYNKFKGEM